MCRKWALYVFQSCLEKEKFASNQDALVSYVISRVEEVSKGIRQQSTESLSI